MAIFQKNIKGLFWECYRTHYQCAGSSWVGSGATRAGHRSCLGAVRVAQHFGTCEGRWFSFGHWNCWTPVSRVKFSLQKHCLLLQGESNIASKCCLFLQVGCFNLTKLTRIWENLDYSLVSLCFLTQLHQKPEERTLRPFEDILDHNLWGNSDW